MSILINMEMPPNCSECAFCGYYGYGAHMCDIIEKAVEYEDAKTSRRDDCPLIPVREHGRLIDADVLFDFILNIYKNAQGESRKAYSDVLDVIVATGDVIPAEEGEG